LIDEIKLRVEKSRESVKKLRQGVRLLTTGTETRSDLVHLTVLLFTCSIFVTLQNIMTHITGWKPDIV
jgi:hypothetical protein